jgi:hypothetical protein
MHVVQLKVRFGREFSISESKTRVKTSNLPPCIFQDTAGAQRKTGHHPIGQGLNLFQIHTVGRRDDTPGQRELARTCW